ncbi:MAG: riboflavin synthase, partial [Candidatus Tectomicrobia bacterium]|nr:riboflavin synthase [Candidatus Tectomicrobia bacterium]
MFTGIVEHVGTVTAVNPRGKVVQFAIDCGPIVEGVRLGDSIAINGTDLTVTTLTGSIMRFEMVQETANITNLGELRTGSRVNLERALRADGRYDGHLVQGHVDGTGTIHEWRRQQEDVRLFVSCSTELASGMVPKGSITVDGVSLTLVDVGADFFSVALIPYTLSHTILGDRKVGDRVNLE